MSDLFSSLKCQVWITFAETEVVVFFDGWTCAMGLIFGILFGAIGVGYIVYGRKQHKGIALLCGVILCAFPYFLDNAILIIGIGVVLMAIPFFVQE